jgi:flagellar motor switch protein FliN
MSQAEHDVHAAALEELGVADPVQIGGDLSLVLDVPVELAVEIGRTTMTIRETLAIAPGSIISLDRMAGEPVDLLVNGTPIARGEVVVIDEQFGLRITDVLGKSDSDAPASAAATDAPEDVAA